MENNYKSLVAKYGVFLGVLLSLITVLAYVFSPVLFTKWWLGIFIFLVIIIVGIFAVIKARKQISGFMNFKQAFTAFFIPLAIGTLINSLVTIVIFNFVDPDTAEYINEEIIEVTREQLQAFGTPVEAIDTEMAKMEGKNPFAIATALQSYIFGLAFYAFVGLIVALIFRQKDPHNS